MSALDLSLMDVCDRPSCTMVSGSGAWLTDDSGQRYLDFVQGWAVNCLGHSPAIIVDAITAQANTLISCSPAYYNASMRQLAQLLTKHSGLDEVFFCSTGAEANEGAIKLARKWGKKNRAGAFDIITLNNSFHGRTLATMSASGKPQWDGLFEPKVPGFNKVPINDIDAIAKVMNNNTVAVMLEPLQGEAGVVPADINYLKALRELTQQHNTLLIVDEIQTGIGRTGTLFAYEQAGIIPDIVTLGKGLGGGVPLAALLARREVSCFDHGDQGSTFSGNPLMTAIGFAVVSEVAKPAFLNQVVESGQYLRGQLQQLSDRLNLAEIRGAGLLLALKLHQPNAGEIAAEAFKKGLLINAPQADVLRFMPALNVSQSEIKLMIKILAEVIFDIKAGEKAKLVSEQRK